MLCMRNGCVVLKFVTMLRVEAMPRLSTSAVERREHQQSGICTVGDYFGACVDKLKARLANYTMTEYCGFSELKRVVVICDLLSTRKKIEAADTRILNITMREGITQN